MSLGLFLQPPLNQHAKGPRPATPASMQTIHGRAVDPERARHLGDSFAGGDPVHCLPTLVWGELHRPAEARTARLGPRAALAGTGADQGALGWRHHPSAPERMPPAPIREREAKADF
jgi:hypothetical protein